MRGRRRRTTEPNHRARGPIPGRAGAEDLFFQGRGISEGCGTGMEGVGRAVGRVSVSREGGGRGRRGVGAGGGPEGGEREEDDDGGEDVGGDRGDGGGELEDREEGYMKIIGKDSV